MGSAEIEFQLFPRRDWIGRKRWHWRVRDTGNHEILCSSEGYVRRIDAHKAAFKVQRYAQMCGIAEVAK